MKNEPAPPRMSAGCLAWRRYWWTIAAMRLQRIEELQREVAALRIRVDALEKGRGSDDSHLRT